MSHPYARRRFRALLGSIALIALAGGCPTVDLGETPVSPGACRPDPAFFESDVWPNFLAPADAAQSCVGAAGCHRQGDGRSALRFTTDPLDLGRNYDVATRFLDCGDPTASSLLTKPLSGVDPHGGGDLVSPGDAAETTFLEWFDR